MRVTWCALALAAAGCGLFLEDLSSGTPGDADDGGAARDVTTADPDTGSGGPPGSGDGGDGGRSETGAPDADAGAPKWVPRLDCDGAVICEGFEGITDIEPGQPCGVHFDQVDEYPGGEATIETNIPALGIRAAKFVSLANTSGQKQILLIGDNDAGLNGRSIIDVDFDMWLDYDPAAFDGEERRNLVGIYITSSKAIDDWEFAGLSVSATKGLHAEMREFASASATVKKGTEDPAASLIGQPQLKSWHHYRLEVTFAKSSAGGVRAFVDGVQVAMLPNLITRTNASDSATSFVFWVGAGAGIGAPALTAIYDDVEVRTR